MTFRLYESNETFITEENRVTKIQKLNLDVNKLCKLFRKSTTATTFTRYPHLKVKFYLNLTCFKSVILTIINSSLDFNRETVG